MAAAKRFRYQPVKMHNTTGAIKAEVVPAYRDNKVNISRLMNRFITITH